MKYKIIETNQAEHSIVVRFFTPKTTEAMLAVQVDERGNILRGRTDYSIDLPVPAPRGGALDAFIMGYAPTAWFARVEAVADGVGDTSLDFLSASVGVEQIGGPPPEPMPPGPPMKVTRRQARQALLLAGLLNLVQPAIDAIPDATQRALMQIEWDDSQEFERNRPSLITIGGAIGLDAAGIDALFVQADAL